MFRLVAARGTTVALRATRPAMYAPMRLASSSSGSNWESTKQEIKKDFGNVVDSAKQAGKEWAKDAARTDQVNHPYIAREGPEPTPKIKQFKEGSDKAAEGVQWAKEKAGEAKEAIKEGAEFVKNKVEGPAASTAKEGAQWAKEKVQEGVEKGKEVAQDLKNKAETEAQAGTDSVLATANVVVEKAQEFAQKTYETVAPAVSSAFATVKPVAEKAYTEYVKPAASAAYEYVKEKGKEGVEFIKEKGSELASAAPSAAEAKEFAKEKGSELLHKGKEGVEFVKEKGKEALSEGKEAVSQGKETWDKTKREAVKEGEKVWSEAKSEGKEAWNTVKQEAGKKITPKDNDQPRSGSIPGQQRKIDVEGDKPLQWETASEKSDIDSAYKQGQPTSTTERRF